MGIKKLITLGILTISTMPAFADNAQVDRILEDPVLVSIVQAIENKHNVFCNPPNLSEISFKCINGSQCGYSFKIKCLSQNTTPKEVITVNVEGYDNGAKNSINSIQLSYGTS